LGGILAWIDCIPTFSGARFFGTDGEMGNKGYRGKEEKKLKGPPKGLYEC
jgi:hypothetical protein